MRTYKDGVLAVSVMSPVQVWRRLRVCSSDSVKTVESSRKYVWLLATSDVRQWLP